MRVDDLDEYSREFYERALFKRCLSLVFAAIVSKVTDTARDMHRTAPRKDRVKEEISWDADLVQWMCVLWLFLLYMYRSDLSSPPAPDPPPLPSNPHRVPVTTTHL